MIINILMFWIIFILACKNIVDIHYYENKIGKLEDEKEDYKILYKSRGGK